MRIRFPSLLISTSSPSVPALSSVFVLAIHQVFKWLSNTRTELPRRPIGIVMPSYQGILCVVGLGQHRFRLKLVACLRPNHYPSQCWCIVYWSFRSLPQWNLEQKINISHKIRICECRLRNIKKWRFLNVTAVISVIFTCFPKSPWLMSNMSPLVVLPVVMMTTIYVTSDENFGILTTRGFQCMDIFCSNFECQRFCEKFWSRFQYHGIDNKGSWNTNNRISVLQEISFAT